MDGVRAQGVVQQRTLDAGLRLLEFRRTALAALERGTSPPDAALVGTASDLSAWTMRQSHTWSELLSTRPVTRYSAISRSMPNNRALREHGLRMVSVFDEHGTDLAARQLLEREPDNAYFFGCAPIQMRLVDGRFALLEGFDDPRSLLRLSSPQALEAAYRYWHAVMATARPCRQTSSAPVELSNRQRCILELLFEGLADQDIAQTLNLSVRTIRAEIARAMSTLGARSRAALGYEYAMLTVSDRAK